MTEYVTQKQYDTSEHLAKKLNNRASVLIMMADNNSSNNDGTNTNTNTNYDKAIVLLSKALKEMEKNMLHHDVEICTCECTCNNLFGESTESEIQSESDHHHHQQQQHLNSNNNNNSHHQQTKKFAASSSSEEEDDNNNNNSNNNNNNNNNYYYDGFVYRRPFLVPKSCIKKKHYMGNNLSLIILFNLALAHHLNAIASITIIARNQHGDGGITGTGTTPTTTTTTTNNNNNNNNSTTRKLLQKALQLYELSYQLIVSDRATGCYFSGSLRLTMIITNNLSEIHRIVGNTKKHTMCLQHLLCAIMYMVDSSVDNDDILNSNELDGFFCNVSPIMSGTNKDNACAQVA
jgi:hypothetical protein